MYFPPGVGCVACVVSVALHSWSNVTPQYSMYPPSFTLLRFFVYYHLYSRWRKRCFVEVKIPLNCCVCQHSWVSLERSQNIYGRCGLWDYSTPHMHWETGVCDLQPCDKVIFPCPGGPLRCVDTVNMWGHQLVFNIFLFVVFIEAIQCLIIQPMEPWYVSFIS